MQRNTILPLFQPESPTEYPCSLIEMSNTCVGGALNKQKTISSSILEIKMKLLHEPGLEPRSITIRVDRILHFRIELKSWSKCNLQNN